MPASALAGAATWGDTQVQAHGLSACIARATEAGDFHRVALGMAVMSLFVVALNRAFWRPLYRRAGRRYAPG